MTDSTIFSVVKAKEAANVIPNSLPISDMISKEDINKYIKELSFKNAIAFCISFSDPGIRDKRIYKPDYNPSTGRLAFHESFNFYDDGKLVPLLYEYSLAGYDVTAICKVSKDGTNKIEEISDFIISWDAQPPQPVTDEDYVCIDIKRFVQQDAENEISDGGVF